MLPSHPFASPLTPPPLACPPPSPCSFLLYLPLHSSAKTSGCLSWSDVCVNNLSIQDHVTCLTAAIEIVSQLGHSYHPFPPFLPTLLRDQVTCVTAVIITDPIANRGHHCFMLESGAEASTAWLHLLPLTHPPPYPLAPGPWPLPPPPHPLPTSLHPPTLSHPSPTYLPFLPPFLPGASPSSSCPRHSSSCPRWEEHMNTNSRQLLLS